MISISEGKQADVSVLDELMLEPGAFYVMDRGYVDFERLYRFRAGGRVLCHPRQSRSATQPAGVAPGGSKAPACAAIKSSG